MHAIHVTPETMPLERLEAEITQLAGHLAAGECRWLTLVGHFDRRRGYVHWGWRSTAAWLGWHCGLDARAARERVRVARALEGLPVITEAFAAGRLSYSKVRALTRVAGAANEADLVMLAEHATAAMVERIVATYRGQLSAEEEREVANVAHARRFLRCDPCDDGTYVLSGRITGEAAAIVLAALDAARESGPAGPPAADSNPAGTQGSVATTNADALVVMAETLLATGPAARNAAERHLVVVNVDAHVLSHDAEGGLCELDGGPALAPETARRLACDASAVVMARDEAGNPVQVGARTRTIPTRLRRAVRARDEGCRFPACGGRRFVDVHHVRHRAQGGTNELGNLVTLCWFHHRLVHEGGWGLRLDADGVVHAIRPNGEVLARHRGTGRSGGSGIEGCNRERGVIVHPDTCIPRWAGERLDLDHIMTSLWQVDHP